MYGEEQHEVRCPEFEALLADALDGILESGRREAFEAHRQSCPGCARLYTEAEAGLGWLQVLKQEEVVPPPALMGNILRATSRPLVAAETRSWWQRLRELPGLAPVLQTILQPRFAMSFAMIFFSISAILSLTGVRVGELRYANLHPSALVRGWYEARGRVEWYYDNIRWVYEFESRLRELKRSAAPMENPSPQPAPSPAPKSKSRQPSREHRHNVSRDKVGPALAGSSESYRPGVSSPAGSSQDRRYL